MTDYEIIVLGVRHNIYGETTDAQAIAFARTIRRAALEEAWNICNANAAKLNGSKETASGYVALVLTADDIRALSQKDPQ